LLIPVIQRKISFKNLANLEHIGRKKYLLEYWGVGVVEDWNNGMLEYWGDGAME
jgi:hypothetical protein